MVQEKSTEGLDGHLVVEMKFKNSSLLVVFVDCPSTIPTVRPEGRTI